jgi:4-aminobutyrate aminotransferase-like enzyme
MLERLRAMQEKYEFLGDVRGAGLLIGLDLVKDRQSKIGLRREVTELIFQEALKRGLLMMGYMPRVRLNPPLTISLELAETGLAILDEVFDFVADKVDYQA